MYVCVSSVIKLSAASRVNVAVLLLRKSTLCVVEKTEAKKPAVESNSSAQ